MKHNQKKEEENENGGAGHAPPVPEEKICCGGGCCEEKKSCEKCDEYLIGWKRALADYDNLKKDLMKEREGMRRAVKEDVAKSIIPILDHFDQALKFKPEGLDVKVENWLTGMLHVRNQLESVLWELGIEPFGKVGDVFDPNLHESVGVQASSPPLTRGEYEGDLHEPEFIVEVSLRGWKMGGRVIRPAGVVIASHLRHPEAHAEGSSNEN